MNTIKLGSSGDDVKTWQGIIKVTQDGAFGPATQAATITYQKAHKLAADGIVGPATWAAAGYGSATATAKNSNSPTDEWAYNIAKTAAPDMPEEQRQYTVAVARGEGYYGKGWTGDGADSNNWGAVQGTGNAGSFQHLDHHADGTPYTTAFKKYATPQDGFLDMAHILLKPNVQAALKKGNLHDAVYAQHSNGYFELAPDKYLAAVTKNYTQLTANVGWKKLLAPNGISIIGKILGAIGIGTALLVGAKLWLR